MKFSFLEKGSETNVLCLGAHPDDIEIGCGGTVLRLIDEHDEAQFTWIVFSGDEKRRKEAQKSADAFFPKKRLRKLCIQTFRESYFPYEGAGIKDYFEELKKMQAPDVIFTHYRGDAHQDHRLISDLTWNTFRDSLILEYEIPKYDGDLGNPNLFIHLSDLYVQKKIDHILNVFETQRGKRWFTGETFSSILRLRGVESNSPSGYSEAFYCRKAIM